MQQAPVVAQAPEPNTLILTELRGRARELELRKRTSDLLQQELQRERAQAGGTARQAIDQRLSVAHDEYVNAMVNLEATNQQIKELEGVRVDQPVAITVQPPSDPFLGPKDIVTVYIGGVVLLLPLVLALSRRLWVRSIRRESVDLENSPRLQRIEQAVESIAIEVERIGEAQRFTTKLFAERQGDAASRIPVPVQPRREPGVITPH